MGCTFPATVSLIVKYNSCSVSKYLVFAYFLHSWKISDYGELKYVEMYALITEYKAMGNLSKGIML